MHGWNKGIKDENQQAGMMCAGAQGDPLILDSDPVPYTQGRILSYDKDALTVDAELLEGYNPPVDNARIKLFTPEGVMLPHTQDPTQDYQDLGELACQLYPVHHIQCLPRSLPFYSCDPYVIDELSAVVQDSFAIISILLDHLHCPLLTVQRVPRQLYFFPLLSGH